MTWKQIECSRRALAHAGSPAGYGQTHATLTSRLTNECTALRQKADAIRNDYRKRRESWTTQAVPENVAVCAIPSDMHDARVYRITAVFAILAEAALAVWVFAHLALPPAVGVIAAALTTAVLHGMLTLIFSDNERPRRAVWRLRRIVILPAVLVFLAGLCVAVLGRYLRGPLALMLLPLLGISLWALTLSLMLTAAALWTLAHMLGWSGRFEREYKKADAEERATADFLRELSGSHPAAASVPVAAVEPVEPPHAKPDGRAGEWCGTFEMVLLAIALAAAVVTTACAPGTAAGGAAAAPRVTAEAPTAAVLDVYIDWSGSCVRSALEEAWKTFRTELPEIAERYRIGTLSIWRFDEDGWCPERLKEIALPALERPVVQPETATEWDDFANIRQATLAADESQRAAISAAARARYRAAVTALLKALEAGDLLPPAGRESRKTDIAGLLGRIAQSRGPRPQYVIVLTDLADTEQSILPAVAAPEGGMRAVTLLVPAQPRDCERTLRRVLTASEQFEVRTRQLAAAAPWAKAAPYFAHDLAALFSGGK